MNLAHEPAIVGAAPVDPQSLTDDELVRLALRRGARDERPFRELHRRHQATIWRACYGFLRNREDAEDLTQDVFVKAYRNLAKFEGRSSFKTWVYRIAINTCQNELRRRSRRPQESESDVQALEELIPDESSALSGSPEKYWSDKVPHQRLEKAFAQLRPEEREVLQLKDLDELPYVEIAEQLDIGLSAAKMRVQRARQSLLELYRKLEAEEKSE